MPRDFDKLRKERDLDFVIGSQTFSLHILPANIVEVWADREEEVDTTDQAAFRQMCIDRIADGVADGNGSEERWRNLNDSSSAPSYGELLELARWVWEVQSDLPTMQPSPSTPGRGAVAASSKDG